MHWIWSRGLAYSEVVETRSNYKKSYLWWFRNPACDDSTRSNQIEKYQVVVPPRLVWKKGDGEVVWFCVCEAPLEDWANGGSADVFFKYGMILVLWGFKGCDCYILSSLFYMSERKDLWNKKKCFLFHFESSFRSWFNQILTFQLF